jgi:hypothetical protein
VGPAGYGAPDRTKAAHHAGWLRPPSLPPAGNSTAGGPRREAPPSRGKEEEHDRPQAEEGGHGFLLRGVWPSRGGYPPPNHPLPSFHSMFHSS